MKHFLTLAIVLFTAGFLLAQAAPTPAPDLQNPTPPAATSQAPTPAPAATAPTAASDKPKAHLFRGAKIYIAPINGGYDIYLTAAIQKKQVPVTVVIDRSKADFEIAGVSDSEKAGWAKIMFLGADNSNDQASIKVADLKTGEIVFGYNVNKHSSVRGKQSTSEACAKHMKENIEENSK